MTPRARRRWLIALPVLLLPTLLLAAVLWYLGSGKAIRDIQAQWATYFPGELLLERLQLEGVGTLGAEGLGWRANGHNHLTVDKVSIHGNPLAGQLDAIIIDKAHLALTRNGRSSWEDLTAALVAMMDTEEPYENYPTPVISLRNSTLRIENETLEDLSLETTNLNDGSMSISLKATHHDKPWHIEALMAADYSLTITKLDIDFKAQALIEAILAFLPGNAEPSNIARELPENIRLIGEHITVKPNGAATAELAANIAKPWRGISALHVNAALDSDNTAIHVTLTHSLGTSLFTLQGQGADMELTMKEGTLPVAELIGADWPLRDLPAPQAVDMRGSSLRRSANGAITGAIRLVLPDSWAGLQQINIDQILATNHFQKDDSLAAKKTDFRLILNSGHEHPLHLQVGIEEQSSKDDPTITQRSFAIHGTKTPVSSDTLLSIARNFTAIPELPSVAKLMIPQTVSFEGLALHSDLTAVDGIFAMQWPNGHVKSTISSSLATQTASFQHIDFAHQLIGQFKGNATITRDKVFANWTQLALSPSTLTALSLYLGLPHTTPQAIHDLLTITPQGAAELSLQEGGPNGSIRLNDQAQAVSSDMVILNDSLTIDAKGLPLSLINTVYPSISLQGEIVSFSSRLQLRDSTFLPQKVSLTTTPVSGTSGDWAGSSSAVRINATFSQNSDGDLIPEEAEIFLDQLSGSHRGFSARIPGLRLNISRKGAEKWLNELRIPSVPGHLSAELHAPNWSTALPESGAFFANMFDIAKALRSISLRDETGTPRNLLIPQDLTAQLDGQLHIEESAEGYEVSLDQGKLSRVTWLPWINEAEMTLQGTSLLAANSLKTKLHGAVKQGKFNLMGHLIDIQTDNLVYGLSFNQNENGLHIDDLFFKVTSAAADNQPTANQRQPLVHISGHIANTTAADLQLVVDEIDIGWVTSLPDLGIPEKIQLNGRARSILDLRFDGENTLTTEGLLFPIGVDVDVSSGRIQIENMSGSAKILPRSWLLRSGTITPAPSGDTTVTPP